MDFITGDIKQLYRKFLTASMASAMVMSIYSFVDTIAVGQSEGPAGAAASVAAGAAASFSPPPQATRDRAIASTSSIAMIFFIVCSPPM